MSAFVEPRISGFGLSVFNNLIFVISNVTTQRYEPVFAKLVVILKLCLNTLVLYLTNVGRDACGKASNQGHVVA